ncbi:unnamed protein product, partial [Prorocentrum cordatum]
AGPPFPGSASSALPPLAGRCKRRACRRADLVLPVRPPGRTACDRLTVLAVFPPLPETSFHACVAACARGQRWEGALRLSADLRAARLEPSADVYAVAASACEQGRQWERALALAREAERGGLRPGLALLNAAACACAAARRWDQALLILGSLPRRRLAPDLVSLGVALGACSRARQWQRAVDLLAHCAPEEPDAMCCATAVQACAAAWMWEAAIGTLRAARARGRDSALGAASALVACEAAGHGHAAAQRGSMSRFRALLMGRGRACPAALRERGSGEAVVAADALHRWGALDQEARAALERGAVRPVVGTLRGAASAGAGAGRCDGAASRLRALSAGLRQFVCDLGAAASRDAAGGLGMAPRQRCDTARALESGPAAPRSRRAPELAALPQRTRPLPGRWPAGGSWTWPGPRRRRRP